jgi:hypothetical protein
MNVVDDLFWGSSIVFKIIFYVLSVLTKMRLLPNGQELLGIASITGVPVGGLFLMQYVYETSAACTSLIGTDMKSGLPFHLRTMDWDFEERLGINLDLHPLVIEVSLILLI